MLFRSWLKTTDDGDDKDRVMRKSDGSFTYFVPDVAYHASKWKRGFHKVINVQGSDHHGTIARVRSGLQGVAQKRGWDIPKTYPDYVLHKMVTVMRHGEEVKISKRAGSYVTVRDLVEWSGGVTPEMAPADRELALQRGRNAVRFFLISRKADTEFIFDIDLSQLQQKINDLVASSEYLQKSQQAKLAKAKGIEPAAEPEEEPLDEWVIGKMQYYAGIKP